MCFKNTNFRHNSNNSEHHSTFILNLRVSTWNKGQQLSIVVLPGKSELSQIVQKEIELRKPIFQRTLNHSRKSRSSLGIRLIRQQSLLHVIHRVHRDTRNPGRRHLQQRVLVHFVHFHFDALKLQITTNARVLRKIINHSDKAYQNTQNTHDNHFRLESTLK